MADQPSIAIIGAGVAGPTLALSLQQVGLDAHLYEAFPKPPARTGGVLSLEHSSLGLLDTIGIPQSAIVPFPSERVTSITVADRREVGRSETIYPGRQTMWQLWNNNMLDRLGPENVHAGWRLTGVETRQDRGLLTFANGEQISPDLTVFADGRRSVGRQHLDPDRQLSYSGVVAWRGQSDWDPRMVPNYHRMEADGTRLSVFPTVQQDGRLGADWTFYMNVPAEQFQQLCGSAPAQRPFVLPHQVSPEAQSFVKQSAQDLLPAETVKMIEQTSQWSAAPLLDIPAPTQAHFRLGDTHAVLLGDALAPVYPLTGRGANNGVEQAQALTTVLGQVQRHGADLTAGLTAWEQRVLPSVREDLASGHQMVRDLGLVRAHPRAAAALLRSSGPAQPMAPPIPKTPPQALSHLPPHDIGRRRPRSR
ncbi:FAD-dependent monooxygenase [Nonomuraea sp. NPDC046802]|uniref:FAD-dependent monooxygenase n=1 Tax=Nonomuraea sp. NPDC046802 TaxID=3154919 RepID=UPI0033C2906F